MKKSKTSLQHTATGILIASDWNENGKPIGVALYSAKEEIFFVAQNKCIPDMLNCIQMKVRLKGEICLLPNGNKLIHVKTFKILEDDLDHDDTLQLLNPDQ
jgi:hypothetical protein